MRILITLKRRLGIRLMTITWEKFKKKNILKFWMKKKISWEIYEIFTLFYVNVDDR